MAFHTHLEDLLRKNTQLCIQKKKKMDVKKEKIGNTDLSRSWPAWPPCKDYFFKKNVSI